MTLFYLYLISGIILIILELVTTTLYLLIIGVVFIICSLIAFKFDDIVIISIITIILSIIGCLVVYYYKRKHTNLVGDLVVNHIGQEVKVISIHEGHLRVQYSGSQWNAKLQGGTPSSIKVGDYLKIVSVQNNNLILN